jgi:hypothetical protein
MFFNRLRLTLTSGLQFLSHWVVIGYCGSAKFMVYMKVLSHFPLSDNFFMTLFANMSNTSSSLDGTKSNTRGNKEKPLLAQVLV